MALRKKQPEEKQVINESLKKKLDKIYSRKSVGRMSFKPLQHKDGTPFDDVDYMEMLGRKAIKMEEEQKSKNPNIPVNYSEHGYSPLAMELGKRICKQIDDKRPREEVKEYMLSQIDFSEIE